MVKVHGLVHVLSSCCDWMGWREQLGMALAVVWVAPACI